MSLYDENEKEDFFENSEVPEKPQEPKKPAYTPDDPRYWEEPESQFEHLRPSRKVNWKLWAWVLGVGILAGLLWVGYIRVFNAYVQMGTQYGYVESIEKRGDLFKTYEGVLLPYKSLMDTIRPYEGDFEFSTSNPTIAARLKEMQYSNLPVRVNYDVYHTVMPWRGDTKVVITRVDSVDPRNILPPDRTPAREEVMDNAEKPKK